MSSLHKSRIPDGVLNSQDVFEKQEKTLRLSQKDVDYLLKFVSSELKKRTLFNVNDDHVVIPDKKDIRTMERGASFHNAYDNVVDKEVNIVDTRGQLQKVGSRIVSIKSKPEENHICNIEVEGKERAELAWVEIQNLEKTNKDTEE